MKINRFFPWIWVLGCLALSSAACFFGLQFLAYIHPGGWQFRLEDQTTLSETMAFVILVLAAIFGMYGPAVRKWLRRE